MVISRTISYPMRCLLNLQEQVTNNHVMLYMKGNPSMPMCGFSGRVVQALQSEGVDFSSVNVLDYPDIREAVKKYS
jgi:monothiol glutaredoxin